jgi:hypothetical protein
MASKRPAYKPGRSAFLEWLDPVWIGSGWDARRVLIVGCVKSTAFWLGQAVGIGRRRPGRAPDYYRPRERLRRVAWWLRCRRIMLRAIPGGWAMHWHMHQVRRGRRVMHPGKACCRPGGRHWGIGRTH